MRSRQDADRATLPASARMLALSRDLPRTDAISVTATESEATNTHQEFDGRVSSLLKGRCDMTKVLLVTQDKGGVGKTLISRGLAEFIPAAPLIEVDSSQRMLELAKRVKFFQT